MLSNNSKTVKSIIHHKQIGTYIQQTVDTWTLRICQGLLKVCDGYLGYFSKDFSTTSLDVSKIKVKQKQPKASIY